MYSSILFDSIYFGYIAKAISVVLITSCWGQKAVGTNYYCDNNAYSLISKDCFILKIRLNGAFLLIDAVFLIDETDDFNDSSASASSTTADNSDIQNVADDQLPDSRSNNEAAGKNSENYRCHNFWIEVDLICLH